ncbi:hypothetical protein [Sphingopyxis sp. PET50]|nr:hypothetical protein [Sphingopyxis sp. PET50]
MKPEKDQRDDAGRRSEDRRKTDNPNYKGPERRSGTDRRIAT